MAQGAGTLFRMVMAGLLMLAALILFSVPLVAHAHGADHYASQTIDATPPPPRPITTVATSAATKLRFPAAEDYGPGLAVF